MSGARGRTPAYYSREEAAQIRARLLNPGVEIVCPRCGELLYIGPAVVQVDRGAVHSIRFLTCHTCHRYLSIREMPKRPSIIDVPKEKPAFTQYCHHCGGELGDGALPLIFPADSTPATPRPGEACGCEEAVWNPEAYERISDPRMARAAEAHEDGQP